MSKEELRKIYLEKRTRMNPEECLRMSQAISDNFFNYEDFKFSGLTNLHLFLPIKNKKEVDTNIIFKRLLSIKSNLIIALSKSNFQDYTMQFVEYEENLKLVENAYGIPEPEGGKLMQPEQLDLVLIPVVAVDETGNRIGYGKGFYDRFLKKCNPVCKKVGLSFEKPVFNIEPDKYDVPLDFCITPEKVYDFRKTRRF
jgi:5-formyltetrahydrofolate cyclo-ligase